MAITVVGTASIAGDKTAATSKAVVGGSMYSAGPLQEIIIFAWQGSVASQTLSISSVVGSGGAVPQAAILAQRQSSGLSGIAIVLITYAAGQNPDPVAMIPTVTLAVSTGNIVAWGADFITFRQTGPETAVAWVGADSASTTSAAPTATSGSATSGDLVVAALSLKGPTGDSFTQDADTTNGSWSTIGGGTPGGTSGGSATTNQTVRGAYKVVTATGTQTYNPTLGTARNYAELIGALREVVAKSGSDANSTTTEATRIGLSDSEPASTVASTGTKSATGFSDPGSAWTNGANGQVIDGTAATGTVISGAPDQYFAHWSAATLGIPAGATITSISVRYVTLAGGIAQESVVSLADPATDVAMGNNVAAGQTFSALDTTYSGDPISYWGLTTTQRDAILTSGIGVEMEVMTPFGTNQATNLDGFEINITYVAAPTPNMTESQSVTTGGGSTAKSGTDTATDSEAQVLTALLSATDIGSDSEAATLTAAPASSDSGSDSEVATPNMQVADSGTGAETANLTAPYTVTDANGATTEATSIRQIVTDQNGGTTEAATVTVPVSASDVNGATVESAAISQAAADVGSDSESATLVVSESAADANGATAEVTNIRQTVQDANGATTETAIISVPISSSDSGSDSEVATLVAQPSASDQNGATTESASIGAAASAADSGTASEAATPNMQVTDAGTISEAALVSLNQTATDTGTMTESAVPNKQAADAGTDSEVASLTAAVSAADANGAVTEATAIRFAAADSNGATTETASVTTPVAGGNDTGTITESASVRVFVSGSDSGGVVAELASTTATITAADSGGVTDIASVTYRPTVTDAATALEAGSPSVSPTGSDTGTGSDQTGTLRLAVGDGGSILDTGTVPAVSIVASETGTVVEAAGKAVSQITFAPGESGRVVPAEEGEVVPEAVAGTSARGSGNVAGGRSSRGTTVRSSRGRSSS